MKNSFGLWLAATAVALVGVTGCATKNYVKTQTAPIIDHTNQLEDIVGTESTVSADYNYALILRSVDAVVQYLASKYGIAAHRFYLIGIGKDKEVALNTTADGRKQNRRVEIQLLTIIITTTPTT